MLTGHKCQFSVAGWSENSYQDIGNGEKLTKAQVIKIYSGAIEGESSTEYLMSYTIRGSAEFVGLERLSGTIGGKSGTIVIRHAGIFADGIARSSWQVVPGSGTAGLAHLYGEGDYSAKLGEPALVTFSYSFSPNSN